MHLRILSVILALLVAPVAKAAEFSPLVDTDGQIQYPRNFRTEMVHLGSWFVPAGEASGFHDVYTERASVEAFRKTGKFPDGATLVKELRHSKSGTYTTGENVSHATGEIKQVFVMIKDAQGRFADNPLWAEGWGWALFKPDNLSKNVAKSFKADCYACHLPAKNNDWVYIEGYPTLIAEP
ncbi:Cytochrome P460 [Microbulbifer donghaiensis]|uniref:Cytochrome P460 n=1 Tax=Microbulbifer donghaiensis TaxID=494016 RepID=A0A1M4UKS9_9GAMM|nr:cytochrome P460 family protein [Microbulbifer donghaiensis]SHE57284.1 Cytochrome P460 [Microbulbifer donghaiensis]